MIEDVAALMLYGMLKQEKQEQEEQEEKENKKNEKSVDI